MGGVTGNIESKDRGLRLVMKCIQFNFEVNAVWVVSYFHKITHLFSGLIDFEHACNAPTLAHTTGLSMTF